MNAIFNKQSVVSGTKTGKGGKKGFTLIEILIVVIILGILAAIVIPQFSSASTQARTASLQTTVQTLRSQVALYKLQHGDTLPNLSAANGWNNLTATSTYNGQTFGPYMADVPKNPLTNASVVRDGVYSATGTVAGADFVYDYGTNGTGSGNIWGCKTTGGEMLP